MKKINDIISWDTVSGVKSGVVTEIKETQFGIEYKASIGDKVVWVNEQSVKN